MTWKRRLAAAFAALTAAALLCGCSPAAGEADTGAPEQESAAGTASQLGSLKSFSAGTLDGGTFTQEDVKAKDVTVVNFWATTCGPCIMEMPDLAAFSQALPDNVQVVTVCLDGADKEADAQAILAEAGFEGVTLITGDGDLLALCGNLMYTPTTVFADSSGNLVGDPIVSRQENLSETFLAAVNEVLRAGGKAEAALAE